MLGWILITLASVAALVSCCVARCCSPLTPLQHCYWTNHLHHERELFEQAAEQHSRLLILQRIKKLFGFVPGSEDVKHVRIPSCQDWKDISAPSFRCLGDDLQGHYSFLSDLLETRIKSPFKAGGTEGRSPLKVLSHADLVAKVGRPSFFQPNPPMTPCDLQQFTVHQPNQLPNIEWPRSLGTLRCSLCPEALYPGTNLI